MGSTNTLLLLFNIRLFDLSTLLFSFPNRKLIIKIIIIVSLNLKNSNFVKKINDAEAFICKIIKKNVPLLKEILMMALCFIVVLIAMLFNKDFSSVFIFYVCFCIYPSKNFSYLAKMAIIPALLLILVAFLLPSGKYNKQEPYIVSTTCEGLKEIEVKSAIRVGNFVELTTETGPVLININTITRIREIKKSPEDAVKTPPPAAQK